MSFGETGNTSLPLSDLTGKGELGSGKGQTEMASR